MSEGARRGKLLEKKQTLKLNSPTIHTHFVTLLKQKNHCIISTFLFLYDATKFHFSMFFETFSGSTFTFK